MRYLLNIFVVTFVVSAVASLTIASILFSKDEKQGVLGIKSEQVQNHCIVSGDVERVEVIAPQSNEGYTIYPVTYSDPQERKIAALCFATENPGISIRHFGPYFSDEEVVHPCYASTGIGTSSISINILIGDEECGNLDHLDLFVERAVEEPPVDENPADDPLPEEEQSSEIPLEEGDILGASVETLAETNSYEKLLGLFFIISGSVAIISIRDLKRSH